MRTRTAIAGVVLTALFVAGCSTLKDTVKEPEVTFRTFNIESVNFTQATVSLLFDVVNPNRFSVPLKGYRYSVTVGDHAVASADEHAGISIGSRDTGTLTVPVTLRYADVIKATRLLATDDIWPYRVEGEITIDTGPLRDIRVPFSHTGEVPRPMMPKIRIESMEVRDWSLFNLEMDVRIEVENTGSLTYALSALSGVLTLNGQRFASITALDNGIVLDNEPRLISVPINVSASNLIQGLLGMFERGEAAYEFSGSAQLQNDTFGELPFEVDSKGSVPLLR